MVNKFLIFCLSICAASNTACAVSLSLSPGSLTDKLNELRYCKDDIVALKGQINSNELELLRCLPPNVGTLDLSEIKIDSNKIPPYTFVGSNVTLFKLPVDLETIGAHAFAGSAITQLEMPVCVTTVEEYAFADCIKLQSMDLSKVSNIGSGVFKGCVALKDIKLPENITTIPEHIFDGCISLTSGVPSTAISVGDYAYRATSFERLQLSNVRKIGEYAFADMPNLHTIILNDDFIVDTSVGSFFNDKALSALPKIDSNLSSLLFSNSNGAINYYVCSPVIGEGSFANTEGIDTLRVGASVREFQKHAFRNVMSLKMVDVTQLRNTIPVADQSSFSGLENNEGRYDITLNVASGCEEEWKKHAVWGLFDIVSQNTGVDVPSFENVNIEVRRDKNLITVKSTANIDLIEVFSINGQCEYQSSYPGQNWSFEIDTFEPKILRIFSAGQMRIEKI